MSGPYFECEDCIGMIEHGCYCAAVGATAPGGPAAPEEIEVEQGCICGMSSVNSASIDPPEPVRNKNCPLHGNEAARDPDAAYERHRDEPPMRMWGEDY